MRDKKQHFQKVLSRYKLQWACSTKIFHKNRKIYFEAPCENLLVVRI